MINKLLTRHAWHPATFMFFLWSSIYLLYFFAPVALSPKITILGTLFIVSHLCLFCFSSIFFSQANLFSSVASKNINIANKDYDTVIKYLFIIGLISCLLVVINKTFILPTLNLQSITLNRAIQANHVLSAKLIPLNIHTFLSVITLVFTSAGFISLTANLIEYEQRDFTNKILCSAFMFMILLICVITGSRSSLIIMFALVAITSYSRLCSKKQLLPACNLFKISFVAILIISFFYSNLVWTARSQAANKTSAEITNHYKQQWGLEASPKLKSQLNAHGKTEQTKNIILPIFYFIHSLITTEKILAEKDVIPRMYGSYHIDLLSAALRSNEYTASLQRSANQILLEKNIYGFFAGAWGALFIDFGFLSFIIVIIWGGLSGIAWRNFTATPSITTALTYTLSIYAILISFSSPPFGFSNSLMLFFWLWLFLLMIKKLTENQINRSLFQHHYHQKIAKA